MKTRNRWTLGRLGGLVAPLVFIFGGCADDAAKDPRPPEDTFAKELYGVLCQRVGAQALHEDLTGESYAGICNGSGDVEKVDTALLPPPADERVRKLAIAKIEALARRRTDLIAALAVVFPEDTIVGKDLSAANPADTCNPVSGQSRRDQLRELLDRLLPVGNQQIVPESSRALAQSVQPLTETQAQDQAARDAIAHIAARRGTMPADMETGLLGAILTAPRLRETLAAITHLVSTDADPYGKPNTVGTGHDALGKFYGALRQYLAEPVDEISPLGTSVVPATGQTLLSRPRTTLELVQAAMLTENTAFANGPPLWVVKRDRRGLPLVKMAGGKVPSPFVDANNDGLADIDRAGHFVVAQGAKPPPDPFTGDDQSPLYEYVDARTTATSALLRHLAPLADPDGGKEALVATLQAQEPLLRPDGQDALLDVVHALGQAAADPGTDDLLALSSKLFKEQPQLMARLTGDLLDAKASYDAHPEAAIPPGSTMIDDVLAVLVKISQVPGLLEETLASMGDDNSLFLKDALPPLFKFNDQLTYDPKALNDPPINLTNRGNGPSNLVDRGSSNTGWNRSLLQRFLQLIHDTQGVSVCNKEGGLLHALANLNGDGVTWSPAIIPFTGIGDPECGLFKIEGLGKFYLRSLVGQSVLHFRDPLVDPTILSAEALYQSTRLKGATKPPGTGADLILAPEFLNRLVFFDIAHDSPNVGDPLVSPDPQTGAVAWPAFAAGWTAPNGQTNFVLGDLQGPYIPSSACKARDIDDPYKGDPTQKDVNADGKIHGLRTCDSPADSLSQRDTNTLFALEFNHSYDALRPLTAVFVKYQQEDLLIELLDTLHKHWSVEGGVATAEPLLAEVLSGDIIPTLNKLTKVLLQTKVTKCAQADCSATADVPAGVVLANGIRSFIDPAKLNGATDRRASTKSATGGPVSLFSLVRDALNADDQVLERSGTIDKWHDARSHIVDEFLTVNGHGDAAAFADPGVAAIAPTLIDLVRSQRLAKCRNDAACTPLRHDLELDIADSLKEPVLQVGLDMSDVFLGDPNARQEIGRLVSYVTRQGQALGGVSAAPSSTPFATSTARAPGALDQAIAASVDAVGALGDLKEVRPLYPILSQALDHTDPQLALLSQLNARAYDNKGHELCSKELDPDEAIRDTLARVTLTVTVAGKPKRSALQIFLDTMGEVNRLDASATTPLNGDDYGNVFKNLHELLTDPTSGLEQFYASVKQATEK